MCRSITPLRGLEPPATPDEVRAAAYQYVRKVGATDGRSGPTSEAVETAVAEIAAATERLLAALPPRSRPPTVVPPNRRR